jgi:type IX secretion system PorP/SprF family membrane protein
MKPLLHRHFIGYCLLFLNYLNAQDLHFTQFELAPVHVNPAYTGMFQGSFRIGGLFRDQNVPGSGISEDFRTPHFYIDANFPWGLRKKDWIGFGINFFQDRSGAIDLGKGGFLATAAYHFVLGKGNKSDIALGAQYGAIGYSVKSPQNAKIEDGIRSGQASQDQSKLNQINANYNDISIGLAFSTVVGSKSHQLRLGVNAGRVNQPSVTLVSGSGGGSAPQKLGMLLTGNAMLRYHYSEKIDLIPMLWFRSTDKVSVSSAQCMLSYLYDVEKKIRLNGGLGYRFTGDLQVMLGLDYGNVKAQLAYDQTIATRKQAQSPVGVGGFEIGVVYVGSLVKKPNPKPKVFCPRF